MDSQSLTMPSGQTTNFNFSMPEVVAKEFRAIGDVHGPRNKIRHAVAAAAVLKLLEMPEPERTKLIGEVLATRVNAAELQRMVETAKSKALQGVKGAIVADRKVIRLSEQTRSRDRQHPSQQSSR